MYCTTLTYGEKWESINFGKFKTPLRGMLFLESDRTAL
jgi:hypothetical protein